VTGVQAPVEAKDFSSSLWPGQFWGPPSLLSNGYGGSFPRGKALPGQNADHSPPSIAGVKNELELYVLFPFAPPWQ
jgi:hypothetical protein